MLYGRNTKHILANYHYSYLYHWIISAVVIVLTALVTILTHFLTLIALSAFQLMQCIYLFFLSPQESRPRGIFEGHGKYQFPPKPICRRR